MQDPRGAEQLGAGIRAAYWQAVQVLLEKVAQVVPRVAELTRRRQQLACQKGSRYLSSFRGTASAAQPGVGRVKATSSERRGSMFLLLLCVYRW